MRSSEPYDIRARFSSAAKKEKERKTHTIATQTIAELKVSNFGPNFDIIKVPSYYAKHDNQDTDLPSDSENQI